MKTLVYILPDKDAGVASVIRNLLRFKTNHFKTKVLLIHNLLDDAERRIQDDFNADEIVRITYNGKWSTRSSVYKKIIKELDSNSLVISNDGGIELDALRYLEYPIPVIYIFHGDFKHYYNVLNEYENIIGNVITVSEYLKNKIENLAISNPKLKLESVKFPVPLAEKIKRTPSHKIRLTFVGSLSDRKGVISLFDIANLLEKQSIDYHLSIIGQGEKEFDLKELFRKNKNITFFGKLDNREVYKIYAKQDIILLPSKGEGLPVVIVEAMKHGVVPIATNLESGIPELIEHSVNGFTVELGDYMSYVDYIEQLHYNRSQLKKMSKLCIEKSEKMFNPELQTKRYEDAFNKTKAINHNTNKNISDYLPITIAHRIKSYFK